MARRKLDLNMPVLVKPSGDRFIISLNDEMTDAMMKLALYQDMKLDEFFIHMLSNEIKLFDVNQVKFPNF